MLLRIIALSIISHIPFFVHAQGLTKEFASLNSSVCTGSGLLQLNTSLHQNTGIGRKHLAHLLYGARISYIRNSNALIFSPPRDPQPDFSHNKNIVSLGTLNLLFGAKVSITPRFFFAASAELLGITFGSVSSGTMTFNGKMYEFEAKPIATNFLLHGNNGGNLFHCMEVGYLCYPNIILRAGVASQGIVYNYNSNLSGYNSFKRSYYATAGFIGIEWIINCKRR